MNKLNLGSYIYPLDGWVNVDIDKENNPDVLADLNQVPWAFVDGRFDEVRAIDIIEHLGELTKVKIIAELARVTKQGARVMIRVPASTHPIALQSIQHAHVFYIDSFETNYAQPYFYAHKRWVSICANRFEFEFKRPFRPVFRFLARFGFIYCIRYELIRNDKPV